MEPILLYFSGKGGTNKDLYEITLEFNGAVNPQVCKQKITDNSNNEKLKVFTVVILFGCDV